MNTYLSKENQDLMQLAKDNAQKYQSADPFPSISFQNFFNEDFLNTVLDEFPDLSKKQGVQFEDKKEIKLAGKGERFFGDETKKLMHFLNSEPFLQFLQTLTGIKEPLIGDPYFEGGGQHETKKGGLLKIHADFNKHPTINLDRRINVLVYLNKDWKDEYGGHFELWDREMENCVKKILPAFNTLAMFSTTDFSYHGLPDPLTCPDGRSRKSLALYYYSNGRPSSEINKGLEQHTTIFKERKNNARDEQDFTGGNKAASAVKTIIKEVTPPFILKGIKGLSGKN